MLEYIPEYVNLPELAFGWPIVAYFFLGGLSAGTFLFSVGANYWAKDTQPLARIPAIVAPFALGAGMLLLLWDLGRPERFFSLYTSFTPNSMVWLGTWFLTIFLILSLLYAFKMLQSKPKEAKLFGYLGVPFAILVATYTGLLLDRASGKPLWNTALLPMLFLNGAMISGVAASVLASFWRHNELLGKVSKLLVRLVLLELALIVVEVVVLFNHGGDSASVAKGLLTGPFSLPFVGFEIILGSVIPIFLLVRSKAPSVRAIASVLILIGIVAMRFVVVIGGQAIK